jgi:hypothetical protein
MDATSRTTRERPLKYAAGPAVKTNSPGANLVAGITPSVAFGLGPEFWPQGQAPTDTTPIAQRTSAGSKIRPQTAPAGGPPVGWGHRHPGWHIVPGTRIHPGPRGG